MIDGTVKHIIEQKINLIESYKFDDLFRYVQESWIPSVVNKLAQALESANIFPLPHMTYIPEGYFWLSPITDYETLPQQQMICYKAFYASDVQTIIINSGTLEIDEQAFLSCDDLQKVYIHEGLKYINNQAFYDCDNLTNVTLPKSLIKIGHSVFNGCGNLTEIKYQGTTEDWSKVKNHEFINEGAYISKIICSDGTINL